MKPKLIRSLVRLASFFCVLALAATPLTASADDASLYDATLKKYVRNGHFAYGELKANALLE